MTTLPQETLERIEAKLAYQSLHDKTLTVPVMQKELDALLAVAREYAELVRKMTALREIIKGDMDNPPNTLRANDLLLQYQGIISIALVGKETK